MSELRIYRYVATASGPAGLPMQDMGFYSYEEGPWELGYQQVRHTQAETSGETYNRFNNLQSDFWELLQFQAVALSSVPAEVQALAPPAPGQWYYAESTLMGPQPCRQPWWPFQRLLMAFGLAPLPR
ncbi:MAG: hypothetical protein INF43_02605 [Alphaproteobacteria bacterium]|jgi:hypothetical protein|nr:hypothetical protein [Alphaproteobacteria bacterium]